MEDAVAMDAAARHRGSCGEGVVRVVADRREAEHQDEFTGPPLRWQRAGSKESRAQNKRVEQIDPGCTDGEVFIQMVDDHCGAKAEGTIRRDIAEADGQK